MLSVRQAYTLAEVGHDFDDTKSESSVRSIALFESTVEMLTRLFERIEQKIITDKQFKDSGLVIQSSIGSPLNPRNLMRTTTGLSVVSKKSRRKPDYLIRCFPRFGSKTCDILTNDSTEGRRTSENRPRTSRTLLNQCHPRYLFTCSPQPSESRTEKHRRLHYRRESNSSGRRKYA